MVSPERYKLDEDKHKNSAAKQFSDVHGYMLLLRVYGINKRVQSNNSFKV
jgi:hypothetical protein